MFYTTFVASVGFLTLQIMGMYTKLTRIVVPPERNQEISQQIAQASTLTSSMISNLNGQILSLGQALRKNVASAAEQAIGWIGGLFK